jgi:hypothetical protein
MKNILDSKTWKLLCSLKLTIILTSGVTLVVIGGSLLIPFNSRIFSGMDNMPLGPWIDGAMSQTPWLTWWVPFGGILAGLLGVNALCCFVDWATHIRARWRKCGEYLIHLGFMLILLAFIWGSQAGFRSDQNPALIGQDIPLSQLGVSLRLEAFEPVLNDLGRPIDMLNTIALYRDHQLIKRVRARINHPLTWNGLIVIPASYGQTLHNGRYLPYSLLTINYDPGAPLAFGGALVMTFGVMLTFFSFYRKRTREDIPDIV